MRYLLHDVFCESVEANPDRTAIIHEDGNKLSYRELNLLVNRFASFMRVRRIGLREQPYIGILSPVSSQSIAAVLGTLKVGGTYVPLDEQSPANRLSQIIQSTKLDIIFVSALLYEKFQELFSLPEIKHVVVLQNMENIGKKALDKKACDIRTIYKESAEEPPILNQVSDDLAYILHTSGSTGVPKGIMLTHRNARTFVDWMQKEFQLKTNDIVMSRAPLKFDLSVFDIFNTLKAGATLVCFDWGKARPPGRQHSDYVHLMGESGATILYTTPSTLMVLLNKGGLTASNSRLRTIMYAGEPFPTPQLRKLKEQLPNTRIANIYGPTETNIITYYWIDSLPKDGSSVPLGLEVDDTEIIVVKDDRSDICAVDEVGELWCRGGTVTLGYFAMAEKTRECLVESPFHKYPVKFWRTGDYGRRDANGILHYHGRRDHMVKVKGFRIELGDIESAISAHPKVSEYVVVTVPDERLGNHLICFFSVLPGETLATEELRSFLTTSLPEYMIPSKFYILDDLPQTSSGKVNRILLAEKARNMPN